MSIQHTIDRMVRTITDPHMRFQIATYFGFHDKLSDEEYIRRRYKSCFGKEIDLDNPTTLSEKLNWIKLYDRRPEYTMMVDKYEVKKWVSDKIGSEHVVPALGVWEHFDDIDFDKLPERFVLKCTHDSGGVILVRDKSKLDKSKAKKKLESHLKKNYYLTSREWPYKNVKPRILAEPFIDGLGEEDSVEYKVSCVNGRVGIITACTGPAHDALWLRGNDHYNREWNYKFPFSLYYKPAKVEPQKPKEHMEIVRICEELSKGIPAVRVDVYVKDGIVYFGEMTFFTWGGFCKFDPIEWDEKLGKAVELPNKK